MDKQIRFTDENNKMNLSEFLGLDLSENALFVTQSAGNVIDFELENQKKANWCWAAVSSSIGNYYEKAPLWTQCEVAKESLNIPSCCTDQKSEICDKPLKLSCSLEVVKHFKDTFDNYIDFDTVKQNIDTGNPICAAMSWNNRGCHFVVISGYNDNLLVINDPAMGKSSLDYNEFCNNYLGAGKWIYTYYTM